MKPSLKIKICGLTREQDAVEACSLGAVILGVNLVPGSKRYIDPYTARDIIGCLPPFVSKVGIFADEEVQVVNDLVSFLGLDAAQLHGHEDETYCKRVKACVIKAVRVGGPEDLEGLGGFDVSAFLLDAFVEGQLGGTGKTFPWKVAEDFCRDHRVILAGGLNAANVSEAVRALTPYGVDAASGVESSPGIKDPDLVERFIRTARCAVMGNGGGCNDIAC